MNDRLLASIVESSGDAIISNDLNDIVTSWNRGAERIFGYSAEEMIGRPIGTIADPSNPAGMSAISDRLRRGERVEDFQTVRRAKDGTVVNVSLRVSPLRDNEGRVVGASIVARDLTMSQRPELSGSGADLNQFAYAVSHELREPLRNIANYSELLVRRFSDDVDGDARRFESFIVQGVSRMESLLNDLRTYSLVAAPKEHPPASVDCNKVLAVALDNLRNAIAENQAVITNDALPSVVAYEDHLVLVFQSLISNAIKFRGDAPPRVHIRVQRQDGFWRFSVTDNGIGIEPQYFTKVFGVLKRLHGKAVPGTGLGLAICARVIDLYGGSIHVESQPGQGSTFFFTLPVAE